MPATVVVGGQWGDEGKAKVVDFLMSHHDVVVRYQGGANAGHTVVTGDKKFAFHQIPSGLLYPGVIGLMGNGMVVDPFSFLDELSTLMERQIDVEERLFISSAANVVMPYHKMLDNLFEGERKGESIGSTKKGIGPSYTDKCARTGMRMGDFLLEKSDLHEFVSERVEQANMLIEVHGALPLSPQKVAIDFVNIKDIISPFIVDSQELIHRWKGEGKRIMLEGAQGTLLDIDHGTYPYVTSSSCSVGGALTGSGLAPRDIGRVIGIFKAYTTRVGHGPFPTELKDEDGKHLAEKGCEFGTTTGRPRRCGWFDMVAARYAVNLNGLTEIALTKLDVLSGLEKVRFCTAYELDGGRVTAFPHNHRLLSRCVPVYEEMPGWEEIEEGTDFGSLPETARKYVGTIEEMLGVKVSFISYGAERERTITREGF